MRYPNSMYYAKFSIGLENDTTGMIYSNQYRLLKANKCYFNGQNMIETGVNLIANGESECVYKVKNKSDFTGGFHGDEQLISIMFYIDTIQTTFTNDFILLPCKTFKYIQETSTHESAELIDGKSIVNKMHPIEAIHSKETRFFSTGYESINRLEWKDTVKVDFWYHGISSISKDISQRFYNTADSIIYKCTGNNEFLINNLQKVSEVIYIDDSNNKQAVINSELTFTEDLNEECKLKVWDTSVYTKYYRTFYPYHIPEIGEVWESRMIVAFMN